ncbi:LANO_0E02322g1_1 [Lachancea nothofagi CBS 11611]|uniref:LANO_0E02322g1_1 n=1 Tax=Lachancea nothofagi CBS 11611 TaxID=1266666 RepID=A0A1G4JQD8_9SACH|nr:LANO_0E02322g1_1 [Lachancea nothofagi CBS 11611]
MDSVGIMDRPFTQDLPNFELDSPDYAVRAHTLPANTTGVRQLVIKKQNGRVVAAKSQLIGRMEDALVRWRPPVSYHAGSTAAVKGKHPYQLEIDTKALCKLPAQTSIDSIRHCFETLSNAVSKPRTERHEKAVRTDTNSVLHSVDLAESICSSRSSSASGMVQEIRRSLQSAETRGMTPRAVICEPEPETYIVERIGYSFPIPACYLPHQDVRPVGESTRDNDNDDDIEADNYWAQWCQFWDDFCRDFKVMCAC